MIKEWFAKQRMKVIVYQVFKNGDLGISYAYGDNKGVVYPKIRKIKFDYEKKTACCYFALPNGMDPKEQPEAIIKLTSKNAKGLM